MKNNLDRIFKSLDFLLSQVQLFLESRHLSTLDLKLLSGALLKDQDTTVKVLQYWYKIFGSSL